MLATHQMEAPKNIPSSQPDTTIEEINTRFGKAVINRSQSISFPKGILGMPDKTSFCLTSFPLTKLPQFKLLQCSSDNDLAFAVLPVEVDNKFIEKKDIENACKQLGMPIVDIGLLLIVSVHRKISGVNLSVNARAPLFIDTGKKTAVQYVMPDNKYEIRHMLGADMVQAVN